MATHSSLLAWAIPWIEEPGGLLSVGLQESDTTEGLTILSKRLDDSTIFKLYLGFALHISVQTLFIHAYEILL